MHTVPARALWGSSSVAVHLVLYWHLPSHMWRRPKSGAHLDSPVNHPLLAHLLQLHDMEGVVAERDGLASRLALLEARMDETRVERSQVRGGGEGRGHRTASFEQGRAYQVCQVQSCC